MAALLLAMLAADRGAAAPGATTRVSVGAAGGQANRNSLAPAISADSRVVAFVSHATNLVAGDTNEVEDVFVHDRQAGTTTRVSVASGGTQANGPSGTPAVSSDGRYVAFASLASNLVAGDTNGVVDIFVHDRQVGTTARVSVSGAGAQANDASATPAISGDGQVIAFVSGATNLIISDTNRSDDVFVHDLQTSATTRVSVATGEAQANDASVFTPALSADGRVVAFVSYATNLVAGDTNEIEDVFVHDRQAGTTGRVSIANGGAQANGGVTTDRLGLSADGRMVVFASAATNLVGGDTNEAADIFVHDRQAGTTARASVAGGGAQANADSLDPVISADGAWVGFRSYAANLSGAADSGRRAADIFLRHLASGATLRASLDNAENCGNGAPALSGDGRVVAFASCEATLAPGDTNTAWDIYVHEVAP
ncbi:MAG: PD40 domain-containing protein [Chloroflexi bacterium]|nr:PD40 domain-containing protein [Chloroflexota bacterium]